jgi:hypothetical protein
VRIDYRDRGRDRQGCPPRRPVRWGQFEYVDTQGERHLGRADSFSFTLDGTITPTTGRGDVLDVQFFRHAPQISRVTPSPIGGICFAAVAFLAGFVFVAELVVRWQRRIRACRVAAAGLAAISAFG